MQQLQGRNTFLGTGQGFCAVCDNRSDRSCSLTSALSSPGSFRRGQSSLPKCPVESSGALGNSPRLIQLISSLHLDTESAGKCGRTPTDFFPVRTGVRQRCVLAPSFFSACMDRNMGHVVGKTSYESSGDARTDLDFVARTADAILTWTLLMTL